MTSESAQELRVAPADVPPELRLTLSNMGAQNVSGHHATRGAEAWAVLMAYEPLLGDRNDFRWHLSVSGRDAVPPWEVLAFVGHELRPGVPFGIGIPPRSWWLNVHPHTLHLWQLDDEALVAQWREERRGHQPT